MEVKLRGVVTKKAEIRCPASLRVLDLLHLKNAVSYLRAALLSKHT